MRRRTGLRFGTNNSIRNFDYWGSDFSGNAGILGRVWDLLSIKVRCQCFFNSQFHSLYAWRSVGNANYNAMQVMLRKKMSQGIQFDFNYTYSKSIDLSSDATRVDAYSGLGGSIINAWSPDQLRGVSDFDTTQQFNTDFLVELPFGKGKPVAGFAHGFVEGVIGGWQLSGLARWTSGFPVSNQ